MLNKYRWRVSFILCGVSFFLTGCELPYYWQAIQGQWELTHRRQPVAAVLANIDTPASTRAALTLVQDAKAFALSELPLEDNGSYTHYVDLERDFVVWNVYAVPPLTMEPKQWCYPIAGCVRYRGYFSEADALTYAAELEATGLDTYVAGASAYSTLGWFQDPILSTFLNRGTALDLSALIFHELSHQLLYVPDDSAFNEAFATAVELILLQRWVEARALQAAWQEQTLKRQRRQEFLELVLAQVAARQTLFESTQTDTAKLAAKQRLIDALRMDYEALKQSWGHYDGYDHWMNQPLNNAQLLTVSTYHRLVEPLLAHYDRLDQDLDAFITYCQALAELDPTDREQALTRQPTDRPGK